MYAKIYAAISALFHDRFQKTAAAAAAAVLMLTASGLPAGAAADTNETKKLSVMCLGDSITDGFWLVGGYRNTLCSLVTENGFADQVDFVGPNWGISTPDSYDPNHAGYSGYSIDNIAQEDSISGARTGISSFVDYLTENYPADVIFMQLGTNDILSLYDLDHFGDRLGALADTLLASIPADGMLYLATLPVMDATNNLYISDYFFTVESMDAAVESCNAQIRALVAKRQAQGKRIQLADVNSVLTKADLYDGVHPSEEGYAKLGRFWYQKLTDFRAGNFTVTQPPETTTTSTETTTASAETTTASAETTTTSTEALPARQKGDVNGDGAVSVADAVRLVRALLTIEPLDAEQAEFADMNGDRKINAADLTLLKRAL